MARSIQLTALLVAALLAAAAPRARADGGADATAEAPDLSGCASIVGKSTPAAAGVAAQLLAGIANDPLYTALVPAKGHPSCRLRFQDGGAVQIEYRFRGDTLTLRNDPRIESSEQTLRMKTLPVGPEKLLGDAEHFLYGDKGCRINWSDSETLAGTTKPPTSETVWHGDVCNCRAAVAKDASGHVSSVSFKSAC